MSASFPLLLIAAKIFEASRPEFIDAWKWNVEHNVIPKDSPVFLDIDYSLTTRDIAEVFRRLGIDPLKMPTTHEVKLTENTPVPARSSAAPAA